MIHKIPIHEWPQGLEERVAMLKKLPDELEQLTKLKFDDTYDDLDWFKVLLFTIDDAGPFGLIRYKNESNTGTTVLLTVGEQNEQALLSILLNTLNLPVSSMHLLDGRIPK